MRNLKLGDHPKLLDELANVSNSPGEFIRHCMDLLGLRGKDAAKFLGISFRYYRVIQCERRYGLTSKSVLKYSNKLGIDPHILNKVNSDFKLRLAINKLEGKNYGNRESI